MVVIIYLCLERQCFSSNVHFYWSVLGIFIGKNVRNIDFIANYVIIEGIHLLSKTREDCYFQLAALSLLLMKSFFSVKIGSVLENFI